MFSNIHLTLTSIPPYMHFGELCIYPFVLWNKEPQSNQTSKLTEPHMLYIYIYIYLVARKYLNVIALLTYIVLFFFLQTMGPIHITTVVVLVIGLSSYISASAYSSTRCIHACGNTFSSSNRATCQACARDPPIDFEMCSHACGNTFSTYFRQICNTCVNRVALTDDMCIKSCGNTFSSQFRQICDRCVSNPPLTDTMCIKACGNTFSSRYRAICNDCVRTPPVTDAMCIHACSNTFSSQFRAICNNAC